MPEFDQENSAPEQYSGAHIAPKSAMQIATRLTASLCAFTLCLSVTLPVSAQSGLEEKQQTGGHNKFNGVVALDLSLAAFAISTWGISQWGWFKHSPVAKREGWFGADTHAGGADKTGHFYMSYMLSELFQADFKRHNVENPGRKAALSAMAAMTLVELGDATSDKYGFSSEDLLANTLGIATSWWLGENPIWDDRLDIRMEYWPSNGYNAKNDAVSDYSGMKHLVALRADGFQKLRKTPLRWFELQAGYYTRGFRTFDEQSGRSRHTYLGLGISLPVLAGKNSKVGKLLSYVQPPGFYIEADHQF